MSQSNHPMTTMQDESDHDDLSVAVTHLIKDIEELHPPLGDIVAALDRLVNVTAMSVIAQFGSSGDRAAAVAYLKHQFVGAEIG